MARWVSVVTLVFDQITLIFCKIHPAGACFHFDFLSVQKRHRMPVVSWVCVPTYGNFSGLLACYHIIRLYVGVKRPQVRPVRCDPCLMKLCAENRIATAMSIAMIATTISISISVKLFYLPDGTVLFSGAGRFLTFYPPPITTKNTNTNKAAFYYNRLVL